MATGWRTCRACFDMLSVAEKEADGVYCPMYRWTRLSMSNHRSRVRGASGHHSPRTQLQAQYTGCQCCSGHSRTHMYSCEGQNAQQPWLQAPHSPNAPQTTSHRYWGIAGSIVLVCSVSSRSNYCFACTLDEAGRSSHQRSKLQQCRQPQLHVRALGGFHQTPKHFRYRYPRWTALLQVPCS